MTHPLETKDKADADYKNAFSGRFSGVLRWPDFETLWTSLTDSPEAWYVYEPEAGGPPATALEKGELKDYLASTETYLRDVCSSEFCGAVYADSLTNPGFVKVYNPRLMGGCGMGKAPLPQWIISVMKPVSLED